MFLLSLFHINEGHTPNEMQSRNTKFKPTVSAQHPAVREAAFPQRIRKEDVEDAVVFGMREPSEGRYTTLKRETYNTHPSLRPKPAGEGPIPVRSHAEAVEDNTRRKIAMNTRNYMLDDEASPQLPMISEYRGQLQGEPNSGPSPSINNKINALKMTMSNVFVSEPDKTTWRGEINSIQRSSYNRHSDSYMAETRKASSELRAQQRNTHFEFGTEPRQLQSESRANFRGEAQPRTSLANVNLKTNIEFGNSAVDIKDTLRSLKQVDFRPHPCVAVPAPHTDMQKQNLVLGYNPLPIQSLNRQDYSPTVYCA